MKPVPHGEPYAGNLHVRFDEGAGVPDKGRSALLYTLWLLLPDQKLIPIRASQILCAARKNFPQGQPCVLTPFHDINAPI